MSIRQDVFEKLAFRAAQLFGKEQAALTEATRFVEDCNAKSVQYSQITTFLEDEFVKFAKNRIIEDNDDTDISDDNTLRKDLLAFLGDECYMDNDYLPTDWDSLLDKWECEPNY